MFMSWAGKMHDLPPHHPVMKGLTQKMYAAAPPLGGFFVGVVLRRAWRVLLRGCASPPSRRMRGPVPPAWWLSVALAGRGHI